MTPLETLPTFDPRIVIFLLSIGTTVLGLTIAYVAFRGYQRGSRPMLFVAVGFVLVFSVPFLSFVGNLLLADVSEFAFGLTSGVAKFVGLATILYGLRMPSGDRR